MSLLDLIPAPYRLLVAGVAVAAAAAGAWGFVAQRESAAEARGYQKGHAEFTALQADMTTKALAGELAARAEETRRTAAIKEIENAHQAELQRVRADAAIADAAAGRLRQRVADLIAAARSGQGGSDPKVVGPGPAADDAAGVLADVLGRCVARVRLLAAVADDRGAAGHACERSYEALTPPKP